MSRSILAINSRKELFGFKTNESSIRVFCNYIEGADGVWSPVDLWNEREFNMTGYDRYFLAESAERGVFPGTIGNPGPRAAVYREGAIRALPDAGSPYGSAEALLPDGSVIGTVEGRIVTWRDGAITLGKQNTAYTSLRTTTEDGWIVYTVAGSGYKITDGTEEYPLVVYGDDGNTRPPYQIMTRLSGRRLLAAYYFGEPKSTGNYVLTPTW